MVWLKTKASRGLVSSTEGVVEDMELALTGAADESRLASRSPRPCSFSPEVSETKLKVYEADVSNFLLRNFMHWRWQVDSGPCLGACREVLFMSAEQELRSVGVHGEGKGKHFGVSCDLVIMGNKKADGTYPVGLYEVKAAPRYRAAAQQVEEAELLCNRPPFKRSLGKSGSGVLECLYNRAEHEGSKDQEDSCRMVKGSPPKWDVVEKGVVLFSPRREDCEPAKVGRINVCTSLWKQRGLRVMWFPWDFSSLLRTALHDRFWSHAWVKHRFSLEGGNTPLEDISSIVVRERALLALTDETAPETHHSL